MVANDTRRVYREQALHRARVVRHRQCHLTTDVWFAHTSDGGKTWQQTHVAGPFDFRRAPRPGGFPRLGEYQGLAPLRPHGFAAIFTMARPKARNDPTDIFFARLQPHR